MQAAISSGWPTRPAGMAPKWSAVSAARMCSISGVAITPGATALTRIPSGARSMAIDLVSMSRPPLDVL